MRLEIEEGEAFALWKTLVNARAYAALSLRDRQVLAARRADGHLRNYAAALGVSSSCAYGRFKRAWDRYDAARAQVADAHRDLLPPRPGSRDRD